MNNDITNVAKAKEIPVVAFEICGDQQPPKILTGSERKQILLVCKTGYGSSCRLQIFALKDFFNKFGLKDQQIFQTLLRS